MTAEEQEIFKEKIAETILPMAINMTEDQIRNIISSPLVRRHCRSQSQIFSTNASR